MTTAVTLTDSFLTGMTFFLALRADRLRPLLADRAELRPLTATQATVNTRAAHAQR